MSHRFWAERIQGDRAYLDPLESHHALRVLRLQPGDPVSVFDGSGKEWKGVLSKSQRDRVEIQLIREFTDPAPDPRTEIYVLVSPPKGQRWDFLLEKLTEVGVTGIVPVITARTVRKIRDQRPRWFRIVLSAVKQSGRRRIPTVFSPLSLEEALVWSQDLDARWVGIPGAPQPLPPQGPGRKVGILIGPEGGWTPEEQEKLKRAHFVPFTLGPRILRIETAALVSTTLALLHDFSGQGNV